MLSKIGAPVGALGSVQTRPLPRDARERVPIQRTFFGLHSSNAFRLSSFSICLMPTRYRSRRRPRFSRRRRTRRGSRFYRRRGRRSSTVRLTHRTGAFPDRFLVKLKYVQTITTTTGGSGVGALYQWNLNSIYDPDRSGTGHQPYGHDTLATIFARYRVWKTCWNLRFTSSAPCRITVGVENGTSAPTDVATAAERPRYTCKVISTGEHAVFRGHMYLPRLNGSTAAAYKADDRFQALFGTSPNELMVLNQLIDGDVGQVTTYACTATLTFYCECFDPLTFSQS